MPNKKRTLHLDSTMLYFTMQKATSAAEAIKHFNKILKYTKKAQKEGRLSRKSAEYLIAMATTAFVDANVEALEYNLAGKLSAFEQKANKMILNGLSSNE